MKFNILLLFTLVLFGCSSSNNEAIKNAEELINQKKYLSAYKYLETADPKNSDVDIVLKKIELLQNYFVQSLNHKRFALKDLQNDEDLFKIRSCTGQFVFLPEFNIPNILDSIKIKQPTNYNIHLALASYYGEYEKRFGYRDEEERNYFIHQIKLYNEEAYTNGCKNYRQCYELGVEAIMKDSLYDNGINLLKESISMNHTDDYYFLFNNSFYKSEANYNIANVYYLKKDYDSAQSYFNTCLKYCKDSAYISYVYTYLGRIFEMKKDINKAVESFYTAINFDSNKVYNYISILKLKSLDQNYDSFLNAFYLKNKNNGNFLNDLSNYYVENNKNKELIDFYKQHLKNDTNNFQNLAELNYSISELYYNINDFKNAKKHLVTSRENYLKFDAGQLMLKDIDRMLNDTKYNL